MMLNWLVLKLRQALSMPPRQNPTTVGTGNIGDYFCE
jgi:hypothetical protein